MKSAYVARGVCSKSAKKNETVKLPQKHAKPLGKLAFLAEWLHSRPAKKDEILTVTRKPWKTIGKTYIPG